jgi:hypothetical protein
VMIENRNGLVVDTELVQPSGTAERDAAMQMAARIEGTERVTVSSARGRHIAGKHSSGCQTSRGAESGQTRSSLPPSRQSRKGPQIQDKGTLLSSQDCEEPP